MRRTLLLIPSMALAMATVGACSQQDDPKAKDLEEDISIELRDADSGLTKVQADCFAKVIVDKVGVKAINDIDFSAASPDEDDADELAAAAIAARDTCHLGADEAG